MSKVQDTALRMSLVSFDNITLVQQLIKQMYEFYLSFDSLLVMDIYLCGFQCKNNMLVRFHLLTT